MKSTGRYWIPMFSTLEQRKLSVTGFLASSCVKEERVLTASQAPNLLKQRGYISKDDPSPCNTAPILYPYDNIYHKFLLLHFYTFL